LLQFSSFTLHGLHSCVSDGVYYPDSMVLEDEGSSNFSERIRFLPFPSHKEPTVQRQIELLQSLLCEQAGWSTRQGIRRIFQFHRKPPLLIRSQIVEPARGPILGNNEPLKFAA